MANPFVAEIRIFAGNSFSPAGAVVAESKAGLPNFAVSPTAAMAPQAIQPVGGGQPHENMMPYLCVSYIISLFGIYPSQN